MTPIVLHHGLFGFGQIEVGKIRLSYFHGIDAALAELGHPVIVSRVHPTGGIEKRAAQLKARIQRDLWTLGQPHGKIIIIAHSMGGLDARYMISRLDMAEHVAALVTICTPHRGSPYADWCLNHLGQRLGGLKLMDLIGLDVQAISDLTTDACARFNEIIPDAPGVRYFSIGAARPAHLVAPFFLHSHAVIRKVEGDNDGLVSLHSARWGEHLADWPADHLHAVNRRFMIETHNPTGDIVPYYLKVLEHLQAEKLCSAS